MKLAEFFERIGYVTLKVTNGCNLHCAYCNVEALTPRTPRMPIERYKQVADLLLTHSRLPHVGLEFHGGEPLLMSDAWFEEAVAYGRVLAKQHHKEVEFPLVTNGTLLTEDRLLKLHQLGIQFCMSVDGPPAINDRLRGGGASVERAIKLFKKYDISFGVLLVLSRANYQHMDDEHYKATLLRLHDKGDWVIRCFDCDARRVCRHSCPTSDYNSDAYKEHECRFTKLMYQHLCENPAKAYRIDSALRTKNGPP